MMESSGYSSVGENKLHAVEAVDTRQEKHCLNCGSVLTDMFCAHCGQKNMARRQTLSELCYNFISSFSGYESKFLITCRHLLLKPGFLPMEYNAGRRERYFHPVRMYAFISVIYFFLFTTLPSADKSGAVLTITQDGKNVVSGDSLYLEDAFGTRARYDSLQATLPPADRDGWLSRKFQYKIFDLKDKASGDPSEFALQVGRDFISHISVIFFLLLPVFAAVLWLLNRKKDIYYSEHLVFSICYYNFFFLIGSIVMLLEAVPWLRWIGIILQFAILFYLILAMKRAYGDTWGTTIAKFVSFTVVFGICILAGLLINLLITLMLI
jgi:hypothetical protein